MLGEDRDDDDRVLAPLGLVDGDRVSGEEFVKVGEVVLHEAFVHSHGELCGVAINRHDPPEVPVEDVLVVVVADLHHLVADAVEPPETLDFGDHAVAVKLELCLGALRVQGGLEFAVQVFDAADAAVHGGHHLDVLDGVELEGAWDLLGDEFHDALDRRLGGVGGQEVKVGGGVQAGVGGCGGWPWGRTLLVGLDGRIVSLSGVVGRGKHRGRERIFRELALVNAVGVDDDLAAVVLAEDLLEADHGCDPRVNHVTEEVAGADRWKLVHIADKDDGGGGRDGVEKVERQGDIEHGGFVHDDEIHLEGIVGAVDKPVVLRVVLEEAMDGLGEEGAAFGEALGSAAGGGAQGDAGLLVAEDLDDAADDGGLADAGAAGDHDELGGDPGTDGLALGIAHRDVGLLVGPFKGLFDLEGRQGDGGSGNGEEALGEAALGVVNTGEEDQVLGGLEFEGAVVDELGDVAFDGPLVHAEEVLGGGAGEEFEGVAGVALREELFELEDDAGLDAFGGVGGDPEVAGDLVGGAEADAVDVARELVGVVPDDLHRVVPVHLVDFRGLRGGDSVTLEENHDLSNSLLLDPRDPDAAGALGPDAGDLLEAA